jgi:hypothetical protein
MAPSPSHLAKAKSQHKPDEIREVHVDDIAAADAPEELRWLHGAEGNHTL